MRYELRYEYKYIPDVWFFNTRREMKKILGILEKIGARKIHALKLSDNTIIYDTRTMGEILHDRHARRKSQRRNKRNLESV